RARCSITLYYWLVLISHSDESVSLISEADEAYYPYPPPATHSHTHTHTHTTHTTQHTHPHTQHTHTHTHTHTHIPHTNKHTHTHTQHDRGLRKRERERMDRNTRVRAL